MMVSAEPPEQLVPSLDMPAGMTLGSAPGDMVDLPSGCGAQTHFRLYGQPAGDGDNQAPMIVLLNGINDFSVRFERLAPLLAAATGRRVLTFDAYGRGWSGTPAHALFDVDMHLLQLEELLDHVGVGGQPISLIAHSMGAITAICYAESHPDKMKQLILLAPAGVMKPPLPGFTKLQSCLRCCSCLLPLLGGDPPPGDFYSTDDPKVKFMNDWNMAWTRAHLKANTNLPFANSAAQMPLVGMAKHVKQLSGNGFPVLLMQADKDPMVTLRPQDLQVYRDALGSRLQEHTISAAGHCFFLEKEDETKAVMVDFLVR